MSLLDCVGDIGIILADAFFTLGLVIVFIIGPVAPLFWLFTKVLEANFSPLARMILSLILFVLAFLWIVCAMSVLKCMGY